MTKQIEQLPVQDAELITSVNGHPFVISGPIEAIEPLFKAAEAEFNAQPVHTASKVGKASVEAVQSSDVVLEGRKATVTAKLHDMLYGTAMYDALQQKRADERDLAMATRLGLISLEDVSCRKHSAAIAKLHNL